MLKRTTRSSKQIENKTKDDGLTLRPSEDKNWTSTMTCAVIPEDDLHLVLSQSQNDPEPLVAHSDLLSEELLHIASTTASLRSDFTNVEPMVSRNSAAADVENRLVAIKNRLNNIMTNMGNINYENTVIIKKLPDNKFDEFDTNALIVVGLCEDMLTKRGERSVT